MEYNIIIKQIDSFLLPSIDISGSKFIDNVNQNGKGGAITNYGSAMLINNTQFYSNYASNGGSEFMPYIPIILKEQILI